MSIIHFQTYGPFPNPVCLGLLDQGYGRFKANWYLRKNVTPQIMHAHNAFYHFSADRMIALVVDATSDGTDSRLSFFVGDMSATVGVSRSFQGNAEITPENTCTNPRCGTISCPDPSTPFLKCSPPPPRCSGSERPEGLPPSKKKKAAEVRSKRKK